MDNFSMGLDAHLTTESPETCFHEGHVCTDPKCKCDCELCVWLG
jgi:hypothetical protein